jgi:hypothetical protein
MIFKNPHFLSTILYLFSITSFAQPLMQDATNRLENLKFTQQADSLKTVFKAQGFEVVRESLITMKNLYDKPIIASLKEGTWYRFIFIGDITSQMYEVRMYDWNEKQVVYVKQKSKDAEKNIINYDYIPRFTEFHMIKPVQINKHKKDLTGYVMLFKKLVSTN